MSAVQYSKGKRKMCKVTERGGYGVEPLSNKEMKICLHRFRGLFFLSFFFWWHWSFITTNCVSKPERGK